MNQKIDIGCISHLSQQLIGELNETIAKFIDKKADILETAGLPNPGLKVTAVNGLFAAVMIAEGSRGFYDKVSALSTVKQTIDLISKRLNEKVI